MRRDDPNVFAPAPFAGAPWAKGWTPQKVVRALEDLVLDERRARLRSVIDGRLLGVTVVMDAPHDPHNGAAILRSADAFGVQVVHVVPRAEPFLASRTVAKGTERWVDVIEHASAEDAARAVQSAGFELVATHPRGELTPDDLRAVPKLALVLGNEHDGISAALTAAASKSVRIPMRGFVESLNVSVSAAILLHAATHARPGDLTDSEREALYARGLFRTVPRADEVLAALDPARF